MISKIENSSDYCTMLPSSHIHGLVLQTGNAGGCCPTLYLMSLGENAAVHGWRLRPFHLSKGTRLVEISVVYRMSRCEVTLGLSVDMFE